MKEKTKTAKPAKIDIGEAMARNLNRNVLLGDDYLSKKSEMFAKQLKSNQTELPSEQQEFTRTRDSNKKTIIGLLVIVASVMLFIVMGNSSNKAEIESAIEYNPSAVSNAAESQLVIPAAPIPTTPATSTQPDPESKPVAAPVPTPAPTPVPSPSSGAYFPNCTAARDAGAAPLYRGQPGYRSALDRDSDGVACE